MQTTEDLIPVVEIGEYRFKFKRLTTRKVTKLVRLISVLTATGWQHLQIRLSFIQELAKADQASTQGLMGLMMSAFGLPEVEQEVYEFLSSIVSIENEDGTLEDVTPDFIGDGLVAHETLQLIMYLLVHPDVEMLRRAVEAGTNLPFFRAAVDDLDQEAKTLQTELSQIPQNQE